MIAITGGKGFIGSYLNKEIKEEKIILDLDTTDLSKHVPNIKVDYIFHLAANISVQESIENPKKVLDNNISSVINVCEWARKSDSKIIFSSSAAVYRESNKEIDEDWILEPSSVYGLSKKIGEEIIIQYSKLYGIKYSILRYSNVYGPGQKIGPVIPTFIDKMKKNEDVTIYGDPVRDFVYVEDVAKVTYLMKDYEGIFNVSSGKGYRILEVFNILKELLNYKKDPVIKDWRKGDIKYSVLSNKKIKSILNYSFLDLKEGLKKLVL